MGLVNGACEGGLCSGGVNYDEIKGGKNLNAINMCKIYFHDTILVQ